MFKKTYLFLYALCFMVFSISMIKPVLLSPDEGDHFAKAYALTQGKFILETKTNKDTGAYIDRNLMRFIMQNGGSGSIRSSMDYFTEFGYTHQDEKLVWDETNQFYKTMPGTNYYLSLVYMPHAMMIMIGRALNLDILTTYYLSTAFLALLSLSLILYANTRLFLPPLVIGLLLVPTQLLQLYSSSIDGITFALSILTAVLFNEILHDRQKKFDVILLFISILIVTTSRTHMLPMLLIPIALFFLLKDKKFLIAFILLLLLDLIWMMVAIRTTFDFRVSADHSTLQSMKYYLSNFDEMWLKLINTITDLDSLSKYRDELIMISYKSVALIMPYFLLIISLLVLSIHFKLTSRKDNWFRVICLIIFLSSTFLIFFSLLIGWSPRDSLIIQGIQGRYFTIPLIFLGFALMGNSTFLNNTTKARFTKITLISMAAISIILLLYLNYSEQYVSIFVPYKV